MASNFLLRSMGSTNFMRGLVRGSVQEIRGVCTGVAGGTTWVEQDGAKPHER